MFERAEVCRIYIASKFQYLFNYERMPKVWIQIMEKKMKTFVFGRVYAFRPEDHQAKAHPSKGGVGVVDIELWNRAMLCHWVVRVGDVGEESWRKILRFGFLRDDSPLMAACRSAAGNKWGSITPELSVREIRDILNGNKWSDDSFVGWKDIPHMGNIAELRWRIKYNKIKMPRDGFTKYENCAWCGDACCNSYIYLDCDHMKNELAEWGVMRKLLLSDKEWISDKVDS